MVHQIAILRRATMQGTTAVASMHAGGMCLSAGITIVITGTTLVMVLTNTADSFKTTIWKFYASATNVLAFFVHYIRLLGWKSYLDSSAQPLFAFNMNSAIYHF